MIQVYYRPESDGCVLIQVDLDGQRCNLCRLHTDRKIEWFANCPPQDVDTLAEVFRIAGLFYDAAAGRASAVPGSSVITAMLPGKPDGTCGEGGDSE